MNEGISTAIGRAAHLLRLLQGLSFAELGKRSGLTPTYLRQIERGERDVGVGALDQLATGLGCDPHVLLPRSGRSPVGPIFGDYFDSATDAVQDAILFLLVEPDESPRKQGLLALLNERATSSGGVSFAPAVKEPRSAPVKKAKKAAKGGRTTRR